MFARFGKLIVYLLENNLNAHHFKTFLCQLNNKYRTFFVSRTLDLFFKVRLLTDSYEYD